MHQKLNFIKLLILSYVNMFGVTQCKYTYVHAQLMDCVFCINQVWTFQRVCPKKHHQKSGEDEAIWPGMSNIMPSDVLVLLEC